MDSRRPRPDHSEVRFPLSLTLEHLHLAFSSLCQLGRNEHLNDKGFTIFTMFHLPEDHSNAAAAAAPAASIEDGTFTS